MDDAVDREFAKLVGGGSQHPVPEECQEALDQPGTVTATGFGEVGEPTGRAEQDVCPPRHRQHPGQSATRGQVDQMRQVLPTQDLDSGEETAGRHDLPGDHVSRLGQVVAVSLAAADQGQHESVAALTSGPPGPLHVVGRPLREGRQHDRGECPDVDTHLQGRRAGEDVRVGVPLALAELLLHGLPLGPGEHAGVLAGDDPEDGALQVEAPVVVVRRGVVERGLETPPAAVLTARLADPVGDPVGVFGLLPVAGVAADPRVHGLRVIEPGDPQVTGHQPVHGVAVLGVAGGDDAVGGQGRQQP